MLQVGLLIDRDEKAAAGNVIFIHDVVTHPSNLDMFGDHFHAPCCFTCRPSAQVIEAGRLVLGAPPGANKRLQQSCAMTRERACPAKQTAQMALADVAAGGISEYRGSVGAFSLRPMG